MVLLTIDLIAKSRSNFKKKRGLSFPEYLRTLTHLHFSSRSIEDIVSLQVSTLAISFWAFAVICLTFKFCCQGDLSMCRNLTVLYLYDNQITHICNLGFASNLTHLYMQNNNITHIDNLGNLQKLSKLYLGGNKIAVVEGLETLCELKELHLENQRLAPGEKLLLDPTTLLSLAESLCVLNINNNNIDEIRDLSVLKELQHFSAAGNRLYDMEELEDVFYHWPQLLQMDLSGNPVCKKNKYRDRLIIAVRNLEVLDGSKINELTRQFLVNWKASREAKKNKNNTHWMAGSFPCPVTNDFNACHGACPGHICSHANGTKMKESCGRTSHLWRGLVTHLQSSSCLRQTSKSTKISTHAGRTLLLPVV
ncbi:protein phosphatase 1 regulatory subunit 42 isoform 2-T2 [Spinachia spinachia]